MDLINLLEKKDGSKEYLRECLNTVLGVTQIIVFGAGVGGKKLYEFLKFHNLSEKIVCFSDNNELKFNTLYCEIPVYNPGELYERYSAALVIIASSAYTQIKAQLIKMGFTENNIVLYNFAFSDFDYTDKEFIYDHLEEFEEAYQLLSDEKSRQVFMNILNFKITKDTEHLQKLTDFVDDEINQYFDSDLIRFTGIEVFVDVGCFIGDTMERYFEVCEGKFYHYLGFEPDRELYEIISDKVKANEWRNISLHNIALGNRKGKMKFNAANYGSGMINERVGNSIDVDTLDNVLDGARVDFIKMDIEGFEYEAISGAKNTIQTHKPICAISVYHKREDFYKLVLLLKKLNPDYCFYFRQYRYTPTETVCYAISR